MTLIIIFMGLMSLILATAFVGAAFLLRMQKHTESQAPLLETLSAGAAVAGYFLLRWGLAK